MSNVISGDKLFYWVDRAVWSKRPITADIFLTDYCNNRCQYCSYDEWEIKKMYRHMPLGYYWSALGLQAPDLLPH